MSMRLSGSLAMSGSITATGQIIAQTLNVQQVTSSIVYSSGSNIFGNSLANTQIMTGSVSITGSLSVNGSPVILTNQTSSTMFVQGGNSFGTQALIGTNDTQNLALETNGTVRMTISSSGNVGVGISSPIVRLQASGTIAVGEDTTGWGRFSFDNTTNTTRLQSSKNGSESVGLSFWTQASGGGFAERMIISGSNVGIGTTAPESPLHILGGYDANNPKQLIIAGRENASSVYSGIQFERAGGNTFFALGNDSRTDRDEVLIGGGFGSVTNATAFRVFTGTYGSTLGSERLTILSGGNVGIGTTSPSYKLEVSGIAAATSLFTSQQGLNVSSYGYLSQTLSGQMTILGHNVRASNSVNNQTDVVNGGWISSMIKQYYNDGITFHTSPTIYSAGAVYPIAATERMRIDSNGNVGIGTTSPSGKLQIRGDFETDDALRISSTYGTGRTYRFKSQGGNADVLSILELESSNRLAFFGNLEAGLATGGSTRLYINSSGNVGIGLTSPKHRLHVSGSIQVGFVDALNDAMILSFNGASTYGSIQTFSSSHLALQPSGNKVLIGRTTSVGIEPTLQIAGGIQLDASMGANASAPAIDWWNTNSTGTNIARLAVNTGANIYEGIFRFLTKDSGGTLDERMRITSGGSVGIGTTSPAVNLHITNNTNTAIRIQAIASNGSAELDMLSHNTQHAYIDYGPNQLRFRSTNSDMSAIISGSVLILQNDGNIGVGTTSPSAKFQVTGSSTVVNFQGSGSNIFTVDGTSGRLFSVDDDLTNSLFSVNTIAGLPVIEAFADNTVRLGTYSAVSGSTMNITGSNVGIGTTSPSGKLHVVNNTDGVIIGTIGTDQIVGGRTGGSFGIKTRSGSNGNLILTADSAMYLYTGTSNLSMFINSGGNVGIGTTNPSGKLHVVGGNFYVTNGGITNQVVVGSTTAAASGVAKDIIYVDHTHALLVKLYVSQTTANVGTLVQPVTTAYGSNSMGTATTAAIGNISGITLAYNNAGYYLRVTVTYSGAAPTIYWVVEGTSFGTIAAI